MSTLAGQKQTLRQPIYHALTIPAAGGALVTTYFQNASQTAFGFATNLSQDGRLPYPDSFVLFSPRIVPAFTAAITDAQLVVNCFTSVIFNNRPFFEGPAWLMPGGAGVISEQGGAAAPAVSHAHGAQNPNGTLNFGDDYSLEVEPNQSFRQTLDYNAPAALPVAGVLTWVVWDGLYTRAAQ